MYVSVGIIERQPPAAVPPVATSDPTKENTRLAGLWVYQTGSNQVSSSLSHHNIKLLLLPISTLQAYFPTRYALYTVHSPSSAPLR